MEKGKVFRIQWRDHFHMDGWQSGPVEQSEVIVDTVGFFVGEDKRYYYIAQSITGEADEEGNETMMNVMAILKQQTISVSDWGT